MQDLLTAEEYQLYRRHIDDAMEFKDLTEEFGRNDLTLLVEFSRIEDKLREAFKNA